MATTWSTPKENQSMAAFVWTILTIKDPEEAAQSSSCSVCRRVFHFDLTGRAFHENMCPAPIATSVRRLLSATRKRALHRCRPETTNWTLPICRTLLSSPTMKTADSILSLILFHQIYLWRIVPPCGVRWPETGILRVSAPDSRFGISTKYS